MEYGEKIKHRLKRIEGQVRGVLNMIEEGKNCKEVVSQLTAVRSAVDKAIGVIVASNLATCVREQIEQGKDADEILNEAIELLVKSR